MEGGVGVSSEASICLCTVKFRFGTSSSTCVIQVILRKWWIFPCRLNVAFQCKDGDGGAVYVALYNNEGINSSEWQLLVAIPCASVIRRSEMENHLRRPPFRDCLARCVEDATY